MGPGQPLISTVLFSAAVAAMRASISWNMDGTSEQLSEFVISNAAKCSTQTPSKKATIEKPSSAGKPGFALWYCASPLPITWMSGTSPPPLLLPPAAAFSASDSARPTWFTAALSRSFRSWLMPS